MQNKPDNIFSVTSLNRNVKRLLEQQIGIIWLSGEISNFIRAQSGHWYFTLKDQSSQLKGACFKGNNQRLGFLPKNGDKILARVRVSLYEPRGDYQIIAEFMEPDGEGLLKMRFEELKRQLLHQGIFDQGHKQALPSYPTRVGVVTSSTGAAVHDILSVLQRRAPSIEVVIYPTQVQGTVASEQIVNAIELANHRNEVDILIVGRGGGSLEDLWCFNEENVAMAIYHSELPTISAVGHQVDTTISDFVADVRAATPSAAAEMLSENQSRVITLLNQRKQVLYDRISQHIATKQLLQQRQQAKLALLHPANRIEQTTQQLDWLAGRLQTLMSQILQQATNTYQGNQSKLISCSPHSDLKHLKANLCQLHNQLQSATGISIKNRHNTLNTKAQLLNALNPLNILSRGYSASFIEDRVLTSVAQVSIGEIVTTQLSDGEYQATVTDISKQPTSKNK